MKEFEIYFSDLNEEAQQALLDLVGASEASDMNWDMDILPLAVLNFEDSDDLEEGF